ncbi:MAG: ATP-dependent Clp protease adaptor ClpS [Spirochaetales bacterium]
MAQNSNSGDDFQIGDNEGGTGLKTRKTEKTKKPDMYRVLLLNDDFTPREFVVEVLQKVFRKSLAEAYKIMIRAHRGGHSTVSVYTYDIAMTKTSQARNMAKEAGHPLQFTVEPDK